jgi:hypothetical protein
MSHPTATAPKPVGPASKYRRAALEELVEPLVGYVTANDDPGSAVAEVIGLLLAGSLAVQADAARALEGFRR